MKKILLITFILILLTSCFSEKTNIEKKVLKENNIKINNEQIIKT